MPKEKAASAATTAKFLRSLADYLENYKPPIEKIKKIEIEETKAPGKDFKVKIQVRYAALKTKAAGEAEIRAEHLDICNWVSV